MILNLEANAPIDQVENLLERLRSMGFQVVMNRGGARISLAVVRGVDAKTRPELFTNLPLVEDVMPFRDKYKLTGRDFQDAPTVIDIKGTRIGGGNFTVMAGPCAIESPKQIMEIAEVVANEGATVLRGGAFKPRTSPYDFQGMGEEGLIAMKAAADAHGLVSITEAMRPEEVPLVAEYVDILQIGARNMQNFALLQAAGQSGKPVMLKRGLSATYNEFLLAAEYIVSFGNPQVILCERGIRTFETYTRNTLDLTAVPVLRELTHLPIIVDPSHGTGRRSLIEPMAKASLAVEADGVMIEVHTDPDAAISDAQQTICPEAFHHLMGTLRRMGEALDIPLSEKNQPTRMAS